VCDKLVGISTTSIPITVDVLGDPTGTARRWRLDMHAHRPSDVAEPLICEGSGRLI
jgi:hypothetical protein